MSQSLIHTLRRHRVYAEITDEIKDDDSTLAICFFGILATLTMAVLCFCLSNMYLLAKNKRFSNIPLTFFYLFSLITLISNNISFFDYSLAMLLYFLDIWLNYQYCMYTCLMTCMIYSYVCTGYCYIINWYLYYKFNPSYSI